MLIIDSHAHVFKSIKGENTSALKYGKVRQNDKEVRILPPLAVNTTFTPDILLEYMGLAKVDKAVLLQAPFYGEINSYIKKTVDLLPDKFIGAAYIDLWKKGFKNRFFYITDILKFKIIKIEFSSKSGFSSLYPGIQLNDAGLDWFWSESEKRNLTVVLDLGSVGMPSYQTVNIKNIIQKYPCLKIVICHLAHPPCNEIKNKNKINLWREQILLAKNINVFLDLAVHPSCILFEDFPYNKTKKFINEAIAITGSDKIMWGSDLPGLLNDVTYQGYIKFFMEYCDFLSENDLKKIMGENAFKLFFNNTGFY